MYAAEKTSDKVQQARVDYWQKIREIRPEDLIFIDESGVNLAMVRLYARALKGKRARGEKPQKRGKNISLIAALSFIFRKSTGFKKYLRSSRWDNF